MTIHSAYPDPPLYQMHPERALVRYESIGHCNTGVVYQMHPGRLDYMERNRLYIKLGIRWQMHHGWVDYVDRLCIQNIRNILDWKAAIREDDLDGLPRTVQDTIIRFADAECRRKKTIRTMLRDPKIDKTNVS